MADPKTIYRLMLKLYPARFREEYETPLERQFWDEYRELQNSWARTRFWLGALADLATSIPAELLRELRQDLRYSARVYRRRTLVTGLTLAALALAIGATTGVFSVLNALLLRSLPFRSPERLVEMRASPVGPDQGSAAFHAWRGSNSYVEDAALLSPGTLNLSRDGVAARVKVAETSSNFFALLGIEPELGRSFAAGEDVAGRNTVAIIGNGLWQQSFGGDPRVLGTTIRLNGVPLTVIGVAPPGMDFPDRTAVWIPTVFDIWRLPKSGAVFWSTLGRLKPGLALAQANRLYQAELQRLHPGSHILEQPDRPTLNPLRDQLSGSVRKASLVLMGIVVFVLLIACANVAHLLLSRITERRQELVVRAALGASRARLVQQLVTESTLLTVAAAAAGLAVAQWAARLASAVQPVQLVSQEYSILDWRVLGFAAGVAVLTGLLFGVLPISLIARIEAAEDLVRCQPGTHGSGVRRMRAALIAVQAAFTVILVAGSVTMCRSFVKLLGTDLGFRTERVVAVSVSLAGAEAEHRKEQYYGDVVERLRAVPGVESAGAVAYLPLERNAYSVFEFKLDSAHDGRPGLWNTATPDYFRTVGTTILAGRDFTPADRSNSARVVIVNEEFARGFREGTSLVGRKLLMTRGSGAPYTIVGVVRTALIYGPQGRSQEQVFAPVSQAIYDFMTFVVKVHGKPEPYLAICRDVVQSVDPQVPVYSVETLDAKLGKNLVKPRFYTTAVSFFGVFALLLAVIGIHGAASHSVAQRTHEIGVRLAVGASPQRLQAMLLRQSLLPVAAGMLLGIAGAMVFGRLVEHLVDSADPIGVPTCAAASLFLAATAAVTVRIATRRILRMDPMRVLRAE